MLCVILHHLFQESKVKFHVIGLKCQECGSYNTCRTKAPEEDTKPKVPVGQTRNGPGPGSDQPPEGSSGGASGGASGSWIVYEWVVSTFGSDLLGKCKALLM